MRKYTNGTIEEEDHDGNIVTEYTDGSSKAVYKDKSVVTKSTDNTVVTNFADHTTKTRSPAGNVTMTDGYRGDVIRDKHGARVEKSHDGRTRIHNDEDDSVFGQPKHRSKMDIKPRPKATGHSRSSAWPDRPSDERSRAITGFPRALYDDGKDDHYGSVPVYSQEFFSADRGEGGPHFHSKERAREADYFRGFSDDHMRKRREDAFVAPDDTPFKQGYLGYKDDHSMALEARQKSDAHFKERSRNLKGEPEDLYGKYVRMLKYRAV